MSEYNDTVSEAEARWDEYGDLYEECGRCGAPLETHAMGGSCPEGGNDDPPYRDCLHCGEPLELGYEGRLKACASCALAEEDEP